MRVEEYDMVKCPWCGKEVVVKNKTTARHVMFKDGKLCPGSRKDSSLINDLNLKKINLDSV